MLSIIGVMNRCFEPKRWFRTCEFHLLMKALKNQIPMDLSIINELVEDTMGGTSGERYVIYLISLEKKFQEILHTEVALSPEVMNEVPYQSLSKY